MPSSTGVRPPSSLSNSRPPSSVSSRPISRLSTRHNPRHARSRLIPFAHALVKQVTGFDESKGTAEASDFRESVDFVVKNLEATTLNKGAASVDMGAIDQQIQGLALKARLNIQDNLAEALEVCYEDLKRHIENLPNDLDSDIHRSRIPDHVQFLLRLSTVPTTVTRIRASSYLYHRAQPPTPPKTLTWADIVAEEPFEGEHWEGVYGLPPGFVRRSNPEDGYDSDGNNELCKSNWDSKGSTPSLSPLNSDDLEMDSIDDVDSVEDDFRVQDSSALNINTVEPYSMLGKAGAERLPPYSNTHRKAVEVLQAKQYWKEGWKGDANPTGLSGFNLGNASTLGPALRSILRPANTSPSGTILLEAIVQNEKYINEEDAVREILIAFQSRKNVMFQWQDASGAEEDGEYAITPSTPCLLHFSLGSQVSILTSLCKTATTVQLLRQFVARVYGEAMGYSSVRRPQDAWKTKARTTRTREAFADAIDQEIRKFDKWCVLKEEKMCRAWGGAQDSSLDNTGDDRLVISLLGIEKEFRDTFERSFDVLLDVAREIYPKASTSSVTRNLSAAASTAKLLDRLFENVQENLERQGKPTSETLMRTFVRAVEPVWGMIGLWLRDGMGLGVGTGSVSDVWELEEEFFIESSGLGLGMMGLGLLDPEFWKEGYALRELLVFEDGDQSVGAGKERQKTMVPVFLEHVAEPILGAGKAVGLLRALGQPLSSIAPSGRWKSFAEFIKPFLVTPTTSNPGALEIGYGDPLFSVSIDTLSHLIYEKLLPDCTTADAVLVQVLLKECELWNHLESVEDLFLMKRGDAMSHFSEILFAKIDAHQSWSDFHFLNAAFKDVVEASSNPGQKPWIQSSLVRIFHRGGQDWDKAAATQTVQALEGLGVEYAVPFPLTYIFQPNSINTYGHVFIFLLQARRAKNLLERILVQRTEREKAFQLEMKIFYAMGSRINWILNTLLHFFTIHVIHLQVMKFHKDFRQVKSLDEMILTHDDHLNRIVTRCLLKPDTSAFHQAIISIFDLAIHFAKSFAMLTGEQTAPEDLSRSISIRRHRSRRQRRQRKNAIGFATSLQDLQDSSEDEEDEADVYDNAKAQESFSSSIDATLSYSAEEGLLQNQTDKMSKELDTLVRFLRRGVESLAGGSSEAAPTFGVLAFALQDWDS